MQVESILRKRSWARDLTTEKAVGVVLISETTGLSRLQDPL